MRIDHERKLTIRRVVGPNTEREGNYRIPDASESPICARCRGTGKYGNSTNTGSTMNHKKGCKCFPCKPCPKCDGTGKQIPTEPEPHRGTFVS